MTLGPIEDAVAQRLAALEEARVAERIWAKDPLVWSDDPATPELVDRLGWLVLPEWMRAELDPLTQFADRERSRFDRVVLCGMGGSSLAPMVLARTFGAHKGYPTFVLLDSTHPDAVRAAAQGDLERTLFVISSKSGTTLETTSYEGYFWKQVGELGSQFVAVSDANTPLARRAVERSYLAVYRNPSDIGGRYSALSLFGAVPAALSGVTPGALLDRASAMAQRLKLADAENPGLWLGAVMGEAALHGRDKLTLILSPAIAAFGLWAEQLLAESTGKEEKGILPVAGEPLGSVDHYGDDRLFVRLYLANERSPAVDRSVEALAAAGHPVVSIGLKDGYDLGAEFIRWEFATAVAGSIIGINPFDQPNVAESKRNTNRVLESKSSPKMDDGDLDQLLQGVQAGDYVTLQAFLAPDPDLDPRIQRVQGALRDRLKVPVTAGYGPRFLHSTGQYHKGGPRRGHYIQIVDHPAKDLPIPDQAYTFGQLIRAQADGDREALASRDRPVVRLTGFDTLERALDL